MKLPIAFMQRQVIIFILYKLHILNMRYMYFVQNTYYLMQIIRSSTDIETTNFIEINASKTFLNDMMKT